MIQADKTEYSGHSMALLRLHDSLCRGRILDNSISEFSENEHMRELKKDIENKILTEVHPYKIYELKTVKDQWFTHLPDPTRPEKRRKVKRMGYDNICKVVIDFYRDRYHMDITLGELFDDWARFRRDETAAKTGTVRRDVSLWRTHCEMVNACGHILRDTKVTAVTSKLLQHFFRGLTKDRAYTRQSICNIRGVFSGMLRFAMDRGIITSNPILAVDFKHLAYKPKQNKQDEVFTFDHAQKLLAYLRTINDDPYALAIRLDFNLFARIGEIAALRWENVDFDKRIVYICHQLIYEPELNDDMTFTSKKQVTEDYLKGCTSHGYRTEYLTDEAMEVLKKAKELNPDGEFIFMFRGRGILNTTFNKRLRKYCNEVGIPYHSSHKIRFYVASTAYNGENLAQISKMMGHSQVNTTLHYLRDAKQDEDISCLFEKLGSQKTK